MKNDGIFFSNGILLVVFVTKYSMKNPLVGDIFFGRKYKY